MSYKRYAFEDQSQLSMHRPMGQLLYFSVAEYAGDWQSHVHRHPFAELFYVRSGKGTFEIGENQFAVKKGDLLLINAHIPHTERSNGTKPLRYLVLGINAVAFESQHATKLKNSPYPFLKLREQSMVVPILEEIEEEAKSERRHFIEFCQALYEQLMISLIRENEIDLTFIQTEDMSSTCASLKAYLDNNFQESISLDQMAARLHINKFHLAHRFTSEYGVPPVQYLNSLRIKEAKNLLRSTDYSIAQISSNLGFSSLSYFGQSFKRATGESAGSFRKRYRGLKR